MKRLIIISFSLLGVALLPGCLFSRKNARHKESPAMVGEMEDSFKQRWVDRRAGELTAQGVAADAAHVQAVQEFRDKYPYTKAAQK